jgi:DNA-binding PadR family transcriptional regulator
MAQLEVRWSGYKARGVRGWTHPDDLHLLTGWSEWSGLLCEIVGSGWADEHVASLPCARGLAKVYRITQAGMNEVAALLREPAPVVRVADADEDTGDVYVSTDAHWALVTLRQSAGEWMTAEAAAEPSQRWNREENRLGAMPYRHVWRKHLEELARAGLAESRTQERVGGRGPPPTVYRATACGLTARLLEWIGHDPEHAIYTDLDYGYVLRPPGSTANFFGGSGM